MAIYLGAMALLLVLLSRRRGAIAMVAFLVLLLAISFLPQAAATAWRAPAWWSKLEKGRTYCAVDLLPLGLLLTGPTHSEFRIVERQDRAKCPGGSIVLTRSGILLDPEHTER